MEDLSEEVGNHLGGALFCGGFRDSHLSTQFCLPDKSRYGDMFQSLVLASIIALV
jgi:hypothetical protein